MSNKKRKNGTFIHGIAASGHLDSSGERISVKGIDISSLTRDGVINVEHKSDHTSQVVGKIVKAKKIMKRKDCEDDHQKYFWDKCKMPYLYVVAELFDAMDHTGAKDLVAHLKYDAQGHVNKEAKNVVNFSIEGSKLEKRGNQINKCIARKITVTVTPCNKVAGAEIKEDGLEKNSHLGASPGFSPAGESIGLASDVMMEKSELNQVFIMNSVSKSSVTNWGEMGIGATIKSQPTDYKPKRTFTPETAPEKIRVGDRIDYTKPKLKQKPGQHGKVIMKSKNKKKVEDLKIDLKKEKIKKKQGVPKGANPKTHERCVKKLKSKGHDKSSAYAICNEAKAGQGKAEKMEKAKADMLTAPEHREAKRRDRSFFGQRKPSFTTEDARARTKTKEKIRTTRQKLGKYESNMRKAIAAGAGIGSPGTQTQGAALQKEQVDKGMVTSTSNCDKAYPATLGRFTKSEIRKAMKLLGDQTFEQFDKKEELIEFLSQKLPNNCEKEIVALAKAVAYIHEKKKEVKLASLLEDE